MAKWIESIRRANRTGFYTAAVVVVGSLGYAGFIYEAEPDRGVRLTSIAFMVQLGLIDEARDETMRLLDHDENDWEGLLWLAYLEEAKGRCRLAYDAYRKALPLLEDEDLRWSTEISMASNCLKAERPRTAKRLMRQRLDVEPGDIVARVLLALSYYVLRDDSSFLEEYAKAYAIDPHHDIFTRPSAAVLNISVACARFDTDTYFDNCFELW